MLSYLQIRRFFITLFATVTSILSFLAQSQPHLTLLDIGNTGSLSVKSLNAHIELSGNTAITQLTYEITNKSESLLTANIQLLLPKNAKVIGYALDINGEMRKGVVVPKAKARHSFNTIQNRNIDPGLAEITQGNQFKTEIYPVPAKQDRTISISYIETLAITDKNQVTYKLPLSTYDKGVEMNVDLVATGMPNPPTYSQLKTKYKRQGKRRYSSKIKTKNGLDDLHITYTVDHLSHQKLATAEDGRHYFSLNVPLSAQNNPKEAQKPLPQKVDIYWDVSSSMEMHHQKNIDVLTHILQQYKNSLGHITLITFANDVIQKNNFSCATNCETAVNKALNDPFYDGGTRLSSIANALKSSTADKALIFTDALNTLDSWQPIANKVPTYVFSNQGKRNEVMQKSLSDGSGGYLIKLTNTPLDSLIAQLDKILPSIDLIFENKDDIFDVFYEVQPLDNRLKISGIFKNKSNKFTIKVNEKTLTQVNFNELPVAKNNMAMHDWAIMTLSELQTDPQRNKQKIIQFGVKHNIVTPFTSLLVLETLEQYAEFDIAPPASMTNAANFKNNWKHAKARYSKAQYDPKFSQLIKQWEIRKAWWNSQQSMTLESALELFTAKNRPAKRGELQAATSEREALNADNIEMIEAQGMRDSTARPYRANQSRSAESIQVSNFAPALLSASESDTESSTANLPTPAQHEAKKAATSQHQVSIKVAKWQADASYLKALDKVLPKERIQTYRTLKKTFGTLPVFYMDIALWLYEKNENALAVRVLSNLSELHPEVPELMRMHAYNLLQMQHYNEAIMQLVTVAQLLPYELTSYRDLANAWQLNATATQDETAFKQAVNYYIEALNAYTERDINQALMILHELNRLVYVAKNKIDINSVNLPKALLVNLPLDLFISMQWNKDATDVDLWVTEPTEQTINYQNKKGISGSYLPFDDTNGYGPEIYMNRLSLPGEYNIQAKLYSDRSTKLLGPNTLFLSIYSHYGTDKETVKHTSLRLKEKKEVVEVGSFSVNKN